MSSDFVRFRLTCYPGTIRGADCIGSVLIELHNLVWRLPRHLAADEVLAGPLDLRLSKLCLA